MTSEWEYNKSRWHSRISLSSTLHVSILCILFTVAFSFVQPSPFANLDLVYSIEVIRQMYSNSQFGVSRERKLLIGSFSRNFPFPEKWRKGEWGAHCMSIIWKFSKFSHDHRVSVFPTVEKPYVLWFWHNFTSNRREKFEADRDCLLGVGFCLISPTGRISNLTLQSIEKKPVHIKVENFTNYRVAMSFLTPLSRKFLGSVTTFKITHLQDREWTEFWMPLVVNRPPIWLEWTYSPRFCLMILEIWHTCSIASLKRTKSIDECCGNIL